MPEESTPTPSAICYLPNTGTIARKVILRKNILDKTTLRNGNIGVCNSDNQKKIQATLDDIMRKIEVVNRAFRVLRFMVFLGLHKAPVELHHKRRQRNEVQIFMRNGKSYLLSDNLTLPKNLN